MNSEVLLALAARCEREEPSHELDRTIESALHGMLAKTSWPPPYTSSLDAAVTLVPKGWRLRNMDQRDPSMKYLPNAAEMIPTNDHDTNWRAMERVKGGRCRGTGNSLPLAICAAALRARAALVMEPT